MLIYSLMLSISSSIDSLGIGITYGVKNIKISYKAKVILFTVSFFSSIISIWFGGLLKNFLSIYFAKYLGSFMLILMGIFLIFQNLKKEDKKTVKSDFINLDHSEEKIFSFFIKFLGITIQIIKNPISSDFDNSKTIDIRESLFLGIALSLDSFCIGISVSMLEINSFLFPIAISLFQLIFMCLGNFIGNKLHHLFKIPDNIWGISSAILLILIGTFSLY